VGWDRQEPGKHYCQGRCFFHFRRSFSFFGKVQIVRDGGISSVRAQEIRSPALPHDIRTLSEQGQKENCKLWQVDEWSLPQGNRVHPFRQASESRGF